MHGGPAASPQLLSWPSQPSGRQGQQSEWRRCVRCAAPGTPWVPGRGRRRSHQGCRCAGDAGGPAQAAAAGARSMGPRACVLSMTLPSHLHAGRQSLHSSAWLPTAPTGLAGLSQQPPRPHLGSRCLHLPRVALLSNPGGACRGVLPKPQLNHASAVLQAARGAVAAKPAGGSVAAAVGGIARWCPPSQQPQHSCKQASLVAAGSFLCIPSPAAPAPCLYVCCSDRREISEYPQSVRSPRLTQTCGHMPAARRPPCPQSRCCGRGCMR